MSEPAAWVEVNESHIAFYGSRETAEWWARFRQHFEAVRITTVTVAPFGDVVRVACEDLDHAEWLKSTLIEKGVAPVALTTGETR